MENSWLTFIIIGALIWVCVELHALRKAMSSMPRFGFAQPNDWISTYDIRRFRSMLIRWADKNDIGDTDLDIIAKFTGVYVKKWELDKAGREMSLREVNRWDHTNPILPIHPEQPQ